jgi:branched-chain amino acid transport system substrate-binding protein
MSGRKLRARTRVACGVVAIAALTCVASVSAGTTKSAATPTGKPIIIGAVKAISGFMSAFDVPPLRGAELAVQDINKAGGVMGRPLKIQIVDYHSKPEDAGPAAKDLIGKGASLILTACDFDLGSPAALAAQSANVLAFSDCAGSVQFGVQGIGPLAYTMGNAGRSEGAVMAEFAMRKGWKTAWTLLDTDLLYYNEVCTGFKDRFTELGGKIAGADTFKTNDASIATQINHLRGISPAPATLMICGFPTGGSAAIRQLRAGGFNQPMISSNTYDGDYWKKAVPTLSNFYYANYASLYGDDPNAKVNAFMKRYAARWKGVPDNSNLVTGYSVVQAFALAANKAKSLDGKVLAKTLDSNGKMPLLVGPTTYTSKLHIDLLRRQEIMKITNGKTHFLQYWTLKKPPKVKF